MRPLPRAASGSVVTLDADVYNSIAENLERMDKWTVRPPLGLQQTPAGNLLSMSAPAGETVLVAILNKDTGGGKYKGTILFGNSTGDPTTNFQIQPSIPQSAVDGPLPINGSFVDAPYNALVINVLEQWVIDSHALFLGINQAYYAWGKAMGYTDESPPRRIVYIQAWPTQAVMVQVTQAVEAYTGAYTGKIIQGQFVGTGFQELTSVTPSFPSQDNCWIANVWEELHSATSIPVGTRLWGMLAGYTGDAIPGSSQTPGQSNFIVYTWYPTPGGTPTAIADIQTTQTAGASYGSNEQTMLANLKTDVTNLQAELKSLYLSIQRAGYVL